MDGSISFNGNSLQTYDPTTGVGIISNEIDHTDAPDMNMAILAIANANDSSIGDMDSPSKPIALAGAIKGSSQVDLDQRIDAFKAIFRGKNKNLDINYAGTIRRYIATVPTSGIKVKRTGTKLWATFTIAAFCKPYGRDTTPTELFNSANATTGSATYTPTVGGTAPYQLPIFTIHIDALTGAGDYLQISNNANDQAILIFGQGLTAGDTLVIDCEAREVRLNDELIDYQGTFLELEPGAVSLTYTDGFTTRTVDRDGKYYKRYV